MEIRTALVATAAHKKATVIIRVQPVTKQLHHPEKKRHRASPSEPGGRKKKDGEMHREAKGYLISESISSVRPSPFFFVPLVLSFSSVPLENTFQVVVFRCKTLRQGVEARLSSKTGVLLRR